MFVINGFDLLKLLCVFNIFQVCIILVIVVIVWSEMNEQDFQEYGFVGCLYKFFMVKEFLMIISGEEMIGLLVELILDFFNFWVLIVFFEDDLEVVFIII